MAMNRYLVSAAALGALVGSLGLVHELVEWRTIVRYNAAVAAGHFADAGSFAGDHGIFARAYAAHQAGDYQQARLHYGEIEHSTDRSLRAEVLYNIGNTYLEQATAIDLDTDADRALPLLELAKDAYRNVLRLDSTMWDAKYNLARVLALSPDFAERKLEQLEGLRRTVPTKDTADPDGALP
jgi:mxaK protein